MRARSRWLSAAVVLLLVAAVPAVALGQGGSRHASSKTKPPRQGEWRGKSIHGDRIIFDVLNTQKGMVVQAYDVEVFADCGDYAIGFGVGGVRRKLGPDGTFRVHFYDPFFGSFNWKGTVKGSDAAGFISAAAPILNRDGSTQVCQSGDVAWKATAPPAGQADAGATRHVAYTVHITQSPSGHVTWSTTRG
jgi:hypothetical protein